MEKHLRLALLILSAVIGTSLVLYFVANKTKTPLPSTNFPISAFTPNEPSNGNTEEQIAPDGIRTLVMEKQKKDNVVTYTFSVINHSDNTQKQIFSITANSNETFSIPFNAWSPDYKYVFIKQTSGSQNSYLVMSSSGAPIAQDKQTINFSDLFATKLPDYKLVDVTGWAAPTLIVINTNKSDGTKGPSFWFDLTTQSFIQLSTRFN